MEEEEAHATCDGGMNADIGQTQFLVTGDKLMELVQKVAGFGCACSDGGLMCNTRRYSTAALITLSCQNCEKKIEWTSQEKEYGERQANLNYQIPLAATLTGNSYTRLYAMAKLLNIALPSPRTGRRAMADYGWKAVEEISKRDEEDTIRRIEAKYGEKVRYKIKP